MRWAKDMTMKNIHFLDPAEALWKARYVERNENEQLYPTEWVVRTLAGGNYPYLKLDRHRYPGSNILDMSCGDGRNLGLLKDLGFKVHATEISPEIMDLLIGKSGRMGWNAEFNCGKNGSLPYTNEYFDYVLACGSCYYLDEDMSFDAVLAEFARTLKPGGYFIASIPDQMSFALQGCVELDDGSVVVSNDPFGLRNGQRWMIARNENQLQEMLSPYFDKVRIGHLTEDYFGLLVSAYIFVCQKRHENQPSRLRTTEL